MNIKEFRELLKILGEKENILKELYDFFKSQESPSKAFPNEKYDFNYKTVIAILEENKLYKAKHRPKKNDENKPNFSISNGKNDELMNRTFSIEKEYMKDFKLS